MMTALIFLCARMLVMLYGGEGLNLLLRVLPTRCFPALLRKYGALVGERVRIRAPLTIHNSSIDKANLYVNLDIGDEVFIGRDCMIDLESPVQIESSVTLSHRVMIVTHTDAGQSPLRHSAIPTSSAPVKIQHGTYIGVNVTILQGVTIGQLSVIGAGALVRKDVPQKSVAAGLPAKILRYIP